MEHSLLVWLLPTLALVVGVAIGFLIARLAPNAAPSSTQRQLDDIQERFERAKAEGDLPETASPETLAAFILAMTHGMAVQAKAGFSREMLNAIADQALSTWPTK